MKTFIKTLVLAARIMFPEYFVAMQIQEMLNEKNER
jgi:hypothetical protein